MPARLSKHFFKRETDGTVRLRLRFSSEEASLFEEAAGAQPLVPWVKRTLIDQAHRQVSKARSTLPPIEPPEDGR